MNIEDTAQDHEIKVWELNNVHRKPEPAVKSPGEPGYGPEECEKCGDDMPDVRRAYGFTLCTACKSLTESPRLRRA